LIEKAAGPPPTTHARAAVTPASTFPCLPWTGTLCAVEDP
jgi:hypothetical protein